MIQQFSRLELSSQDYLLSQIGDSQIPSQFHSSPQIDKIDSLVIQNFKSFDKKYVGPFLNFTCIIGPNGSGKSNILDALMFCFCSENSRHSLLDARELINRQGKQSFKDLSKMNKVCSVQATFILKNGEKFTICRTLDAESKEQFLLNYKNVTKKVYQNVLIRKGINCNAPNYAIWQGQIDRLVLKDPAQLTNLLQNLSGSIYYKAPYEETKQRLKEIQSVVEDRTKKINKLKADRKNLKAIKQTSSEYNKYDAQYQQVLKKIYYLQVLQKNRSIEQLENQVKKVQEQEKKKTDEINQLKNNAQKDYAQKVELQDQMNKVMSALAESYAQLKNVDNPANVLKLQKLKQTEQQIMTKQKQLEQMKTKRAVIQKNIPQILPSSLIQEYLSLYQQWQSQNSSLHRQITKKRNQLLFIEGVLQSKLDLIVEFDEKKKKNEEKKRQKKKTLQNMRNDIDILVHSIKTMQSQSVKVASQAQKFRSQFNKKNQSYEQLCSSVQQLQNLIVQQAQDQKQAQMLKTLSNIDGFHGVLHQKIKPSATKYDVCFSMMVGNMGKYLLSQSQECAKKIGNRLKQIRLMKNVIILDNVVEKSSGDIRKSLGKDAVMGIDIVDFDQDTRKLKEFLSQVFYGKVVCDNIHTAYKIRNKNLEGVKEIYTLDGNVIRKDGVVTAHGSIQSLKKLQKFTTSKSLIYQQLSKQQKQKQKLLTDLQTLKLKFNEQQLAKRNNQILQMNRKKQTMYNKLKQLQNQQDKQVNVPQTIYSEIKQLEKQKEKLEKNVVQLEKMIKNSKIFDKFMKKHGIQNLQNFRNANNVDYAEKLMKRKNQGMKEIMVIDGSIEKLQRQLQRKIEQLKLLQEEVKRIPEKGDKSKIESIISDKQKQLSQLRTKISKLSILNRNQMIFQSALPALQAKLVYAKQKISKDLQDLAYELGVQYRYPIPDKDIVSQLDLPRNVTQRTLESMAEKLQQQKSKIQQNLDKHNTINLLTNVEQDQQKVEKGINSLLEDIEVAIKDRKKYSQQLQTIRKDRASVLLNFIKMLRTYLNQSYKLLTQQQDGSTGTVNLHVENQDQPFEHGVYYTPTPPTKRFVYDLEQLSGGQKSIASLALQYSLSLASKSPILILDQTDAFLDTGNVTRFLKLINESLRSHNIQIIVVTHKEGLFSKSESLVGVSRPKSLNLSQVYSLRLSD